MFLTQSIDQINKNIKNFKNLNFKVEANEIKKSVQIFTSEKKYILDLKDSLEFFSSANKIFELGEHTFSECLKSVAFSYLNNYENYNEEPFILESA